MDPQAAVQDPTATETYEDPKYEPIKTEKGKKDGADVDTRSQRGTLSRLHTGNSTYTDMSDDTDAKSASLKRRKWYRTNPLKWGAIPPVPKERKVSPEYSANIFSRLTWQWMQPLMNVGYKRPLEKLDLWTVNPNRSMDVLAAKLETSFTRRLEQGKQRPLLGAMFGPWIHLPSA